MITKDIQEHNGFVIHDSIAYILDYAFEGKHKTAFIAETGYIANEWNFKPKFLQNGASEASIKSMLIAHKFHTAFDDYVCFQVVDGRAVELFRKSET